MLTIRFLDVLSRNFWNKTLRSLFVLENDIAELDGALATRNQADLQLMAPKIKLNLVVNNQSSSLQRRRFLKHDLHQMNARISASVLSLLQDVDYILRSCCQLLPYSQGGHHSRYLSLFYLSDFLFIFSNSRISFLTQTQRDLCLLLDTKTSKL